MGSLGIGELLVILVIVTVLFGAKRLPQIGDSLGKALRSFKKATSALDDTETSTKRELEDAASSTKSEK